MSDTIIIGLISLGAAAYLVKRFFNTFKSTPDCGCSSGGSGCKKCPSEGYVEKSGL